MMDLFKDATLGGIELPNRIVMAPMTRSRATAEHVPTAIMAEYYAARAAAGLLITEGTAPDANGAGYPRIPGLWNQEQIDAWKVVTDAVHNKGGRIAVQLMHTGRVSHPANMSEGAEILAPSALVLDGTMYTDQEGPQPHPTPRAMNEEDIELAIEGFVSASKNAMSAGFDAVELHGANGYLIDQFLTPNINARDDGWGGSASARARFAIEVAVRVAKAIGKERLGMRLSPFGAFGGVEAWPTLADEFVSLTRELDGIGLAFLHLVDHSSMGAPPVDAALKAKVREAFSGTLILSGGYDVERANQDLMEAKGDLVAFGRAFIANPDLVARLREGASLNEPDAATFYTPGPQGYLDYPVL